MNHFKFACGVVAALSLLSVLVLDRSPAPPVVASSLPEPEFETQWRDAAGPLALTSAALPAAAVLPKSIVTEKVALPVQAKPASKARHTESNACTRHGLIKVKHGRHGWRCRK